MPKSGEQEVKVAPRLAAASIAITVSGRFGRNAATTSPGPDAVAGEPGGDTADFGAKRLPAELAPVAALVAEHDGGLGIRTAQQVLGEVERRAREPARAGHAVAVFQRGTVAALAGNAREFPERFPEVAGTLDGPAVERVVVRDARAARARRRP